MTISEYLQNPYGKGSSIGNAKDTIDKLSQEYEALSSRFECKVYKYKDNAILHVVVPSSKKDYVTYDVVLEVRLKDLSPEAITIEDLPFQMFSNCPSFIFTYANAFRNQKLICPWLEVKYRKEVRTTQATIKNQYGIIGLERSLYLACLYLKKSGRSRVSIINSTCVKAYNYQKIASLVRSQDQIMEKVKDNLKPSDTKKISGLKDPTFTKVRDKSPVNAVATSKRTLFVKPTPTGVKNKRTGKSKSTHKI